MILKGQVVQRIIYRVKVNSLKGDYISDYTVDGGNLAPPKVPRVL